MSANKHQTKPARQIRVSEFRQIHHLSLVSKDADFDLAHVIKTLKGREKLPWGSVSSEAPLSNEAQADYYNEYVYYHDFLRRFIYPTSDSGFQAVFSLKLGEETKQLTLTTRDPSRTFKADVDRVWIRVYGTGVAILTVETVWKTNATEPLTLADTLLIADQFRRIYTPFWLNPGTADETPQRVPAAVKNKAAPDYQLQSSQGMLARVQERPKAGPKSSDMSKDYADPSLLFPWDHWLKPLDLAKDWRVPSDERVPMMSFIVLEQDGTARDTMRHISRGDWLRIAEADRAGSAPMEYNPAHMAPLEEAFFYDRFFPDAEMGHYIATRHVFAGEHYALVTVETGFHNVLRTHFRRHYEKMALIARYEYTALLAFSFRVTGLLERHELRTAKGRKAYRKAFFALRADFLNFVHRTRFTGVTSQIQGREMFAKWRASLNLDALFADVESEISAANDFAQTAEAAEESRGANKVQKFGTILGAVLAAPAIMGVPAMAELVKHIAGWGIIEAWIVESLLYAVVGWSVWKGTNVVLNWKNQPQK